MGKWIQLTEDWGSLQQTTITTLDRAVAQRQHSPLPPKVKQQEGVTEPPFSLLPSLCESEKLSVRWRREGKKVIRLWQIRSTSSHFQQEWAQPYLLNIWALRVNIQNWKRLGKLCLHFLQPNQLKLWSVVHVFLTAWRGNMQNLLDKSNIFIELKWMFPLRIHRPREYIRLGYWRRCSPGLVQAALQNCPSVKSRLLSELPCRRTMRTDPFHQVAPLWTSAGEHS